MESVGIELLRCRDWWNCEVSLCCQPLAAWPWVRIKQISCNLLSDPLFPSQCVCILKLCNFGSWIWKFKLHIKVDWKGAKRRGERGRRSGNSETLKTVKSLCPQTTPALLFLVSQTSENFCARSPLLSRLHKLTAFMVMTILQFSYRGIKTIFRMHNVFT